MEQLVILVLIGLVSLINWIVQKSAETRAKRKLEAQEPDGNTLISREPFVSEPVDISREERSEDDRVRNLMNALGLETPFVPEPEEAIVPPPFLPSLEEMAAKIEPAQVLREQWHTKKIPPKIVKSKRKRVRVGALLAAPNGLRNGILLSEVLGPPKALRK
jgi:hypothetical protein